MKLEIAIGGSVGKNTITLTNMTNIGRFPFNAGLTDHADLNFCLCYQPSILFNYAVYILFNRLCD